MIDYKRLLANTTLTDVLGVALIVGGISSAVYFGGNKKFINGSKQITETNKTMEYVILSITAAVSGGILLLSENINKQRNNSR